MIFSTSRHYFPTFQPQNKSPKQSFQPPPSQWSLCPLPHERAEWSDLLRARHEYGAYLSCCSSGEMFPIWIREMLHLKKKRMFGDLKKCWFPANVLLNQSIQNRSSPWFSKFTGVTSPNSHSPGMILREIQISQPKILQCWSPTV